MKDLLATSRGSSPIRERASLSFSAMKSLVLREKEDKWTSEFGADEKVVSVVNALLNSGIQFDCLKVCLDMKVKMNNFQLHNLC